MAQGTTTLTNLRRLIRRAIGDDDITVATTTNIAGSLLLVSTELSKLFRSDDALNGWWAYVRGAASANVQESRKVADFTQSSGTATVVGPVFASESGATTIEFSRLINGTDLNLLINDAIHEVYPTLYARQEVDTVISQAGQSVYSLPTTFIRAPRQMYLVDGPSPEHTSNIIGNAGFENGTTYWAGGDVASISAETISASVPNRRVWSGSQSLKVITTASTAGVVQNAVSTATGDDWDVADLRGSRVSLSVMVYCRTGSLIKAEIAMSSGDTESSFHGGTGWELLTVSTDVPNAATSMSVGISVAAASPATTVWLDHVNFVIGEEVASVPGLPLYNWRVWNDKVTFPYALPPKKIIRMIGLAELSSLSAEADTIELDGDYLDYFIAFCALRVMERLKANVGASDASRFASLQDTHERTISRVGGMPQPPIQKKNILGWGPTHSYWYGQQQVPVVV